MKNSTEVEEEVEGGEEVVWGGEREGGKKMGGRWVVGMVVRDEKGEGKGKEAPPSE